MKRDLTYLLHRRPMSAERVEKQRWKAVALKIKAKKAVTCSGSYVRQGRR